MDYKQLLKESYGLDVLAYDRILKGRSNLVYKVFTKQGKFILKELHHKDIDKLDSEIIYQKYLFNAGIPLPLPIRTKNNRSFISKSSLFILFPYIEHFTDQVTLDNIPEVARVLSEIHKIKVDKNLPQRYTMRNYWKDFLLKCPDKILIKFFKKEFLPLHKRLNISNLPKTIIYGDPFTGNFLFDKKNRLLGLTDWEMVEIYHRLFDISVTLVGCCFPNAESLNEKHDFDFQMARVFISSYMSHNPLTKEEIDNLFNYVCSFILFAFTWQYLMININKQNPHLKELYKVKIKQYIDLRKFGKENFLRKLGLL